MLPALTVITTIATILLQTTATLDKVHRIVIRKQDEILYAYCENRLLVICPDCRIAFEVTGLHEQFNVEWTCNSCGTTFREHATHTVKEIP